MDDSICPSNCLDCPSCPLSIFKDFSPEQSDSLMTKKVQTHFKKGETLFHQGSPSFGIYCIEGGKIKLSKLSEAGEEIIFFIATAGNLIGYQNIEENPEYILTATVLENCVACFISNETINALLKSCPEVTFNLLQQTINRMDIVSSYGNASLHMSALNRVACLLRELSKSFGTEEDGRIKLDLRLTRQEMASMIGTASETMIRSLAELRNQGIIEQEGNFIIIKDVNKLDHFN